MDAVTGDSAPAPVVQAFLVDHAGPPQALIAAIGRAGGHAYAVPAEGRRTQARDSLVAVLPFAVAMAIGRHHGRGDEACEILSMTPLGPYC